MTLLPETVPPPAETTSIAEAGMLARQAVAAYRSMVKYYKEEFNLSHQEAVARTEETDPAAHFLKVMLGPPEKVTWFDLERLGERSQERMLQRWEEIKEAARGELRTGDRAAQAVETFASDCWKRAQFVAILIEVIEGWQPRNGLERLLLDQLALAYSAMLDWMRTHSQRSAIEALRHQRSLDKGQPEPPTLSDAEAVEQAARMVDRFNKMFLRTLRHLRDLRRHLPPVIVQNAGQVNVAGQQLNVTAGGSGPGAEERSG